MVAIMFEKDSVNGLAYSSQLHLKVRYTECALTHEHGLMNAHVVNNYASCTQVTHTT